MKAHNTQLTPVSPTSKSTKSDTMNEYSQDIIIVNHSDNGISTPSDTYTEPSFTYDIPRLQPDSVECGEIIGQGGSACVYKGTLQHSTHSTLVAVKQFKHVVSMRNEMKILTRLRDSNFMLHTFGYIYDGSTVSIVMEYAENGDLLSYLRSGKLSGDWLTKAKICIDIAKALESLHKERVVHLDVKPENILLDSSLTPKLSDFDISKTFTSIANGSSWGRTLSYVSPERIRFSEKKFTHKELIQSEIYAYGILVRELATDGKQLYKNKNVSDILIAKIQNRDQQQYNNNLPDDTPSTFRDIGYQCLEYNPLCRPSLIFVQEEFMAYTLDGHSGETKMASTNHHHRAAAEGVHRRKKRRVMHATQTRRTDARLRKRNRRATQIGIVTMEQIFFFSLFSIRIRKMFSGNKLTEAQIL
ncbi:kinase-like domain-containing protein [Endogone sp. FLAS-F59071]|nr:kinase-like domain-containing protein [Endogone sp. FLAS-F59071]|eukprot:RUS18653.1 kinase-like domain-containing protein [Endogone sp. FLAS-F59071]